MNDQQFQDLRVAMGVKPTLTTEQLSELMRGLEIGLQAANWPPEIFFQVGKAIATLAKGSTSGYTLKPQEDKYLVHAGGDVYQSKIVSASELDDAYLLTQWPTLNDLTPEEREDALSHFHDDDQWTHEDVTGTGARVKFTLSLEDGWVEVIRLPQFYWPPTAYTLDSPSSGLTSSYVDCGECPLISTGCKGKCMKANHGR